MTRPTTTNAEELLRQQESLRQLIESISSELELRPLLTRIVRHACELLGAENGTIGLRDEDKNVIRTEAAYRMPPDEIGAEMAPGVGLAGRVLLTQQPLVLDRYGDIETPTQLGLLRNAVIGVPIFWRGRLTGVFGLGSKPPRRFTAHDAEVLSLFAKHAAIAIENARLFARNQNALDEMQLLYRTSNRISTAMDIEEVVEAYLEQVAVRGRYACTVGLYEFENSAEPTTFVIRGRWSPTDGMRLQEIRVPCSRDGLDAPLNAGLTVTVSDVHTDPRISPELRNLQRQAQRPALAMVPLMVRGQRIGLVILSYAAVHTWRDADLRPYQATAAQLATAMDSRQQQQLLVERGQRVAALEERQRLARDLHDSVTQQLFSINLVAQTIGPSWRRNPAEGEERIKRLLGLSQSALAEMRVLLAELRPGDPNHLPAVGIVQVRRDGLLAALRTHLARIAFDGLSTELDADGYLPQSLASEEALFRITQEALNNVVKHARANRVTVRLQNTEDHIVLQVQDNGIGFDSKAKRKRRSASEGGLGLTTMRERAQTLGGTIHFTANLEGGTTLEVTLPRTEEQP